MKRLGLFLAILAVCFVTTSAVVAASNDPLWAPSLIVPNDTTVLLCEPDSVCFDVSATDPDEGDTLVFDYWGPVSVVGDTIIGTEFTRTICFVPDTAGTYMFTYKLQDSYGHCVYDSSYVTIILDQPVEIADQWFSEYTCYVPATRYLPLEYSNPYGSDIVFELLDGPGVISSDGVISYEVSEAGTTVWQVAAYNQCGGDTITVTDTVDVNQPPVLLTEDSTVYLCEPEEICFDLFAMDPESTPVTITQIEGPGESSMVGENHGQTCFMPDMADSVVYQFVYCLTDECTPLTKGTTTPPCYRDTVNITVIINQPPVLSCPEAQEFFTCDLDTFCFPLVVNDPEFDQLTITVLSENAVYENEQICFEGSENAQFDIVIEAVDICGAADTCTVPVTINGNRPPYVTMPEDFTVSLCELQEICISGVFADDPDFDLETVVPNIGVYNAANDQVCFTADTAGEYTIIVTATDSCGAFDVDTTVVTVTIPDPPVVDLGGDRSYDLCEIAEICLDNVIISGDDVEMLTISFGEYNAESSTLCFTPDTSGVYTLAVYLRDACDRVATDTITVDVSLNTPPTISNFDDMDFYLCYPQEICLEPEIFDADDDIESIEVTGGTLVDGKICFVPYTKGDRTFTITVTDSCGNVAVDTAVVTVMTDQDIDLDGPSDTTVFLCEPDTLCFPITGIPDYGEVTVQGTNAYWNAETQSICFFSDCCIENDLTVSVTTECGTYSHSFHVDVQTNSAPLVILPQDTTVFACDPLNVCVPVGISDIDGNIVDVTVTGASNVTYDEYTRTICFAPDTAGVYTIGVVVTDECGAVSSDVMDVTVTFNNAPFVGTDLEDSIFIQCAPEMICIPIYAYDMDGNLATITSSIGEVTYDVDAGLGTVCFMPDSLPNSYVVTITATDECDVDYAINVPITVEQAPYTDIICPTAEPVAMCDTATLCLPITITGVDDNVTVSYGTYADGELCFLADTSGIYTLEVISVAQCNTDTCTIEVPVDISFPVTVTCEVEDATPFFCEAPQVIEIPVTITGDPDEITILPEGAVYENGILSYEITEAGEYGFSVIAANSCNTDSCGFTIDATFNLAPVVILPADTTIRLCEFPDSIYIPYSVLNTDDDIVEVRSTLGVVNTTVVRFEANGPGEYEMIVTATDSCGATDSDTINITIIEAPTVVIEGCPTDTIYTAVETPGSISVPLAITPSEGVVIEVSTGGSWDPFAGEVVLSIPEPGIYEFTLWATAECNVESCTIIVKADEYFPPIINCPSDVDTALCLTDEATDICLPVTLSGTVTTVVVEPIGSYDQGTVCIPVDTMGEYSIRVIASDENSGAVDTCTFTINAHEGAPPLVFLPLDREVELCEPGDVCVPISITLGDFELVSTEVTGGTLVDNQLCIPVTGAGDFTATVTVTDSCGQMASDNITITATVNEAPIVTVPADFSTFQCEVGEEVCVEVGVSDMNLDFVSTNLGEYNALGGTVCFTPAQAGTFALTVIAVDSCEAADTGVVEITVTENSAPTVTMLPSDTTIYLCYPTDICLDVEVFDLDDNITSVTTNRGTYSDGRVCFVPYGKGTYNIIVTATDACGLTSSDTSIVEVLTDQDIALECPNDTTVFLCEPATLCFPVGGIPEGAEVSLSGTNVYWNAEDNTVCFFSDCCIENDITVTVTTACGSYSCNFHVDVQTNSKPLVILPQDTTMTLCEPEEICVPVGVNDIDGNLATVEAVGSEFTYDAYTGVVCFTPDTAGVYSIMVRATDECDSVGTDLMHVTVRYNSAPTVAFIDNPTEYETCDLTEICVNIEIDDIDGNITDIIPADSSMVYDAESGTLCFTPPDFGEYCLAVRVVDACNEFDTDILCINVTPGATVAIECPEEPLPEVELCETAPVCIPLNVTGAEFTVTSDFGAWENNQLCFDADTSGEYVITVIATALCNVDTCQIVQNVTILEPLVLTCPGDTSVFLCGPDTLCFDFAISSSVNSVTASGNAYITGTTVCVPLLSEGDQVVTLTGTGECGSVECSFTVTTDFNEAPVIAGLSDSALVECSLFEICVPFTASDPNGNIVSVTGPEFGEINDNAFCFTPPEYGAYDIIITVTDECGEEDVDTAIVTITEGNYASIECPDDPFVSLCEPGQVCIPMGILPVDAEITILPASYNGAYVDGRVCVDITEGGSHPIMVIAAAQCSTDTCEFTIQVDMQETPVLSCPGVIDTLLCLVEPTELCFPVEIVQGTGVDITVNPVGAFSAGQVCLTIDTAGTYELEIIGSGPCGADTCFTTIEVTADEEPILTLPMAQTVERCPDDTESICVTGFTASDTESDVVLSLTCGVGEFDAELGELCFVPDTFGLYTFCFEASDGCHTVTGTYYVDVTLKPDCDVCVRFTIDPGDCTPVGLRKGIPILVETNDQIGGYNLLISYDASVLTFITANYEGTATENWEYTTYSLNNGACGNACPSGLVRFVGIADANNGAAHPPESAYEPHGTLLNMVFQVANDQNLGDNFVPINFVWYDCGDNAVSSRSGQVLFVDERIFNAEQVLIWDEMDDVGFPEGNRPYGMGASDDCFSVTPKPGVAEPLRCIEFYNGGLCIIDPDLIDDRGDINLNNLAYEIGDVVVFTNYFVYGLGAFTISVPGQIAATDVNADGLTLSIADLTYLIRVVIGDAPKIPKVNPYATDLKVATVLQDGRAEVTAESVAGIGAAHFVYTIEGDLTVADPVLATPFADMDMVSHREGNELRILVYDLGTAMIPAGSQTILEIPYTGTGTLQLSKVEMADYDGRPYNTVTSSSILPGSYSLEQNYPNPFNPTTTISFALPRTTDWTLDIYNISGALVRSWSGSNGAGSVNVVWDATTEQGSQVASGVYLYRLSTGDFNQSRKMVLLK